MALPQRTLDPVQRHLARTSRCLPRVRLGDRPWRNNRMSEEWTLLLARSCVECPDCAFGFDSVHTDEDGGYSCPQCAYLAQAEQLRELREVTQRAERQLASDPAPSTYAAGAMQKLRAALARGGTTE